MAPIKEFEITKKLDSENQNKNNFIMLLNMESGLVHVLYYTKLF